MQSQRDAQREREEISERGVNAVTKTHIAGILEHWALASAEKEHVDTHLMPNFHAMSHGKSVASMFQSPGFWTIGAVERVVDGFA